MHKEYKACIRREIASRLSPNYVLTNADQRKLRQIRLHISAVLPPFHVTYTYIRHNRLFRLVTTDQVWGKISGWLVYPMMRITTDLYPLYTYIYICVMPAFSVCSWPTKSGDLPWDTKRVPCVLWCKLPLIYTRYIRTYTYVSCPPFPFDHDRPNLTNFPGILSESRLSFDANYLLFIPVIYVHIRTCHARLFHLIMTDQIWRTSLGY